MTNDNSDGNLIYIFIRDHSSHGSQQHIDNGAQLEDGINDLISMYHHDYHKILGSLIGCLEQLPKEISLSKQSYILVSLIFNTVYHKYKNEQHFNTILGTLFGTDDDTITNLLYKPIVTVNKDIQSFFNIYYIILLARIGNGSGNNHFDINSSIKQFFQFTKTCATLYTKALNVDILFNISNIFTLLYKQEQLENISNNSNNSIVAVFKPISMHLVKQLIQHLSTLSIDFTKSNNSVYVSKYDSILQSFIETIFIFWFSNTSNQLSQQQSIEQGMRFMFTLLIQNSDSSDSANDQPVTSSIANILNISPVEMIPQFMSIINSENIAESQLYNILSKLTLWPLTNVNSKWVLETFNSLIKSKRLKLLASLVNECSKSIIMQMFCLELLSGSFNILERMLLGYQHSPDSFHSVIHIFPIVIEFLSALDKKLAVVPENPDQGTTYYINYATQLLVYKLLNQVTERKDILLLALRSNLKPQRFKTAISETLKGFCRLSWTLMHHHTGYPELYSPLYDKLLAINSESPTEFEMKMNLKNNAWTSLDSIVYDSVRVGRTLQDRSGLLNLGNTCYMNSFLQSLYMTTPLSQYLLYDMDQKVIKRLTETLAATSNQDKSKVEQEFEKGLQKDIMLRPTLLKQLQILFGNMRLSIKESTNPKMFLTTLPIEFQTGQQQDSFEFEQHTTCRKCLNLSIKKETFLELSLSFPPNLIQNGGSGSLELETLIKSYLDTEEMVGDNKYHCDKCQSLQDADKQIKIIDTPDHLIIAINRFYFNRETKSVSKILTPINYPIDDLVFNSSRSGSNNFNRIGNDGNHYKLYAVIMHSGQSIHHGHYFTYARPSASKQNDWCLFNDSMVQLSDTNSFKSISNRFQTDVPYILFYSKSSSSSPNNNPINLLDQQPVTTWIKSIIQKENNNLLSKSKNNNILDQYQIMKPDS
ncbi:hypothetical protein CYY_007148 [Polysphondylium violaceum]|uniref:Ubiquitin carboxyl-terminal hydrolase n=1 Tax=Polysphondylium violaceum TaxID=133409 RepID=A0A8J4V556_9MYCE|nr:hypothetical protein CYY_007148 [Polysphondylium violaceum]